MQSHDPAIETVLERINHWGQRLTDRIDSLGRRIESLSHRIDRLEQKNQPEPLTNIMIWKIASHSNPRRPHHRSRSETTGRSLTGRGNMGYVRAKSRGADGTSRLFAGRSATTRSRSRGSSHDRWIIGIFAHSITDNPSDQSKRRISMEHPLCRDVSYDWTFRQTGL